jgi:hypothetical protein
MMPDALDNCQRVREALPLRFLQVRPTTHPDNVMLRIGQGKWRVMHVSDALAFVRNAYRRQRHNSRADTPRAVSGATRRYRRGNADGQ